MRNRVLVFGLGGGLLLAVGLMLGIIVGPSLQALAAGSHPSAAKAAPTPNAYCQLYLQTMSKDLGVSSSKLESANKDAAQTVIDQMYKDGKITQAQKAQAEQELSQYASNPCAALNAMHTSRSAANPSAYAGVLGTARTAVLNAVAGALHLSSTTLETDLNNAQTVAQLTTAQNVSKSSVDAAYLSAMKTQLSDAVSKGTITQAQSDLFYTGLQQSVTSGHYPLLDKSGASDGRMWGPGGMPGGMPGSMPSGIPGH